MYTNMDNHRDLYKTNGLANAVLCAEKRENLLKIRKEKRSAIYDKQRTIVIVPEAKPQKNRKSLKNIANKRRKSIKQKAALKPRPFVVGIVRHRIHSPPFLHGIAGTKNSKKNLPTVPIQSFAPKNYKFNPPKGLKVNILTPLKQDNASPFTLRSLFNKENKKSAKKQEICFKNITVRTAGRKLSFNSPASKIPIPKIKVYGEEKNKHKNVKKQLWSEDPEEPLIFGRLNLQKTAMSKPIRSPFKDKNKNMPTSPISFKKDNIVLSPLVSSQSKYEEGTALKGNCKIDSKKLQNDPSTLWNCRSYEGSTNKTNVHLQYMSPLVQQLKSETCLDEVNSDNSTPTLCQTISSEIQGLNIQETNQLHVEESINKINSDTEEKHSSTLGILDDSSNNSEVEKAIENINITESIENNYSIDQSSKLLITSNNKTMNLEESIIPEINSNDEMEGNQIGIMNLSSHSKKSVVKSSLNNDEECEIEGAISKDIIKDNSTNTLSQSPMAEENNKNLNSEKINLNNELLETVEDLYSCKDVQGTTVNSLTDKSLILTPVINKSIVETVNPLLPTTYKSSDYISSNESQLIEPELEIKENRTVTIKTDIFTDAEKIIHKDTETKKTFTKIIDLLDSPKMNKTYEIINDLRSTKAIESFSPSISLSRSPLISPNIQIVVTPPSPTKKLSKKTLTYEDVLEDTAHTRISNQTQVVNLVDSPKVKSNRMSTNLKTRNSAVIINDSNSPTDLSTTQCKNEIINCNQSVQEQSENDIIDLVSDDEEDYTCFIKRVLAKHGMSKKFSPRLDSLRTCEKLPMISMENIPKLHVSLCESPKSRSSSKQISPPINIPKIRVSLCKTSESCVLVKDNDCSAEKIPELHVTPCKTPRSRRILKENTPTEPDTASPMRVLCLRNKKIDISPSPKKRTPRKPRVTPCKSPKSNVPKKDDIVEESVPVHVTPSKPPRSRKIVIEDTPAEADTASPVRVLCLRSRKVEVSPSPKKNTPRGRKKEGTPRI